MWQIFTPLKTIKLIIVMVFHLQRIVKLIFELPWTINLGVKNHNENQSWNWN
jgi:hypothetical protein